MKLVLFFGVLLIQSFGFTQDSTFRCNGAYVEVKRIGLTKLHTVEGKHRDKVWISGKVKRIEYSYMYRRTFYGSTRPANPQEFYKPIKKKSFYYIPTNDVIIYSGINGSLFQTFSKDSLILRSYYTDGTPRDVHYFNVKLQIDSIHRFYGNGQLKAKVFGGSDQPEDNLVLSLQLKAEMHPRSGIYEWNHENWRMPSAVRSLGPQYASPKSPCYPTKQYIYHGNGKVQVAISWYMDSAGVAQKEFAFYDPNGVKMDSNFISPNGNGWNGIKYSYYENGSLESIVKLCNDKWCGAYEQWNEDGTPRSVDYRNHKGGRDSIVFLKQFSDTLFAWRPPMHFSWFRNDSIQEVKHRDCELHFSQDGRLWSYSFKSFSGYREEKLKDECMRIEHFGGKNKIGLPHGRWFGVNGYGDTLYEVNFHNGYLHGLYKVNSSYWPKNWIRTYDMGLETDSSLFMESGYVREIHYFSEPGIVVKKAFFYNSGRLSRVDTTLNGRTFINLRSVHFDGWIMSVSQVDTTNKWIYQKRFSAPDSLAFEEWTDYFGRRTETKYYYAKTGSLKEHWKDEGARHEPKDADDPNSSPRTIRLASRWLYDESGALIKEEKLENGRVVNE